MTLALVSPTWWQHVAIVAAYTLLAAAALFWVRSWRDQARVRRTEIAVAVVGLAVSAMVNWWWLRPEKFNFRESLPIQMCDLAGLIAPLALLTRARWLRALLHFWGFGLCSQWVCTPVANAGPQSPEFWISFVLHASILGSAAWDVLVRGYRPRRDWSDWAIGVLVGAIYTALMIPLDIAIDANYGYLGRTRPVAPTIVDHLGPWPLRIVWIVLLAILAQALIQVAWIIFGRLLPPRAAPLAAPNP